MKPHLFLLTTVLSLLLPAVVTATPVSGIAAIVNDEIITSYEADRETDLLVKEAEKKSAVDPATRTQIRTAAINKLIDKKLIEQKIRELNIKVSEEEVRQAIEDVKKQNNLSQENLVAALAGQGLSFDAYRSQLKEQLERLRLVSQEVRAKIQVSEKEMLDYYGANPARFSAEEQFRVRHIFLKIPKKASAKDIERIRVKAETVLKEAKGDADFAELAKKYSDDPLAKEGGDLGTFRLGEMLPEADAAVKKLQPGEVSGLIVTATGFDIIKLEQRFAGQVKPFASAKAEIEELLYKKKSEERFNQWLDELRQGAAIEIRG